MIIVTGGAGFIGSNIVRALNRRGENNILLVDNLTNGHKMRNLADLEIADYMDKTEFINKIETASFLNQVKVVFHQGACSSTTEWDGKYVMANNYEYSKRLLYWSITKSSPFIYASSASVYGKGIHGFNVDRACEYPINMYAYSKFQFDQYVRSIFNKAQIQIVGLRYFNVYGPGEEHKGSMSSTIFHFNRQLIETGRVKLFEGCDGYGDGEQQRDFVYVEDVADINLWFYDHATYRGIYNVGTGKAETFNQVARSVINWHGKGEIEYIPFPEHLKGSYQSFTQANVDELKKAGYNGQLSNVELGVKRYLDYLNGLKKNY